MYPIRLFLIDDHRLLLQTWETLLNADPRFRVVGTCSDGAAVHQAMTNLTPDVILCDINLPPFSGFEICTELTRLHPATGIIGLSMFAEPQVARRMMQAGAHGYVTKNSSLVELKQAICEVREGRKYICADIKEALALSELDPDASVFNRMRVLASLTKREIEIIRGVRNGASSRELACLLGIAVKTVEVHRYNILHKLRLPNAAALVNFANSTLI